MGSHLRFRPCGYFWYMEEELNKMGRPTVMTDDVLKKLEYAFNIGSNDREACSFAKISEKTLYNYQKENPDFLLKKLQDKDKPILKATATVVEDLDKVETAKWYLERRKKKDFSSRSELTGAEGEAIPLTILSGMSNVLNNDSNQEDNNTE